MLSKILKSTCYNWMYRHSGNDYRVAMFSIIIHHVKFENDRTILTCLN